MIIFKKEKGLVAIPITAAGSVCHELKRRGKLFIQQSLAGQEDAIAQATVLFVLSNTSKVIYSTASPVGKASTQGTFLHVHGLVAFKH